VFRGGAVTGNWNGHRSVNLRCRWIRVSLNLTAALRLRCPYSRNGTNSIWIEKIALPDGKELTFEGPGGT
jgi:hypothetical protein